MSKKVMISAGEASGELYGALLSRAIKTIWPDTEIVGVGGSRMRNEGVKLIATISGAFGFVEIFAHWLQTIRAFKKACNTLFQQMPDVLVLIDYPDFNIALAKKAKSVGIPILYYVSPQVWAWRRGRVKKIASLVNKIAVLFPFEVDIYKNTGLLVEFVGHPITETININETKEELKRKLGFDHQRKVIALLPGSRHSEIKFHQQLIKGIAERIHDEFPDIQIVIPLVSGTGLKGDIPAYVKVIYDRTTEAIACSDAAVVASGTATLETALLGIPMVVFYKLSALTFLVARLLIKVKFISLVNILSGRKVVEEFIQDDATPEKIYPELRRIMIDPAYRETMISDLQKIKDIMGGKNPSRQVALMVGNLAGWNYTNI